MHTCHLKLDKLLNLSKPQFSHLYDGEVAVIRVIMRSRLGNENKVLSTVTFTQYMLNKVVIIND